MTMDRELFLRIRASFHNDVTPGVQKAEGAMDGLAAKAKSIGMVIAAAFTVREIARMGMEVVRLGVTLNGAAQKVGIMKSEMLAWKYAGEQSGLEFEQLTLGMRMLNRAMAENLVGGGEAGKAMKVLGVATEDAGHRFRLTDAVLLDMADAFARMADGPKKTALSMKIFGESGAQMIPFMNKGAAGIRAMMEEARALGLSMGGATVEKMAEFNRNLAKIDAIAMGFKITVAEQLVPVLNDMIDDFTAWYRVNGDLIRQDLATMIRALAESFRDLSSSAGATLSALATVIWALAKAVTVLVSILNQFLYLGQGLVKIVIDISGAFLWLTQKIVGTNTVLGQFLQGGIQSLWKWSTQVDQAMTKTEGRLLSLSKSFLETSKTIREAFGDMEMASAHAPRPGDGGGNGPSDAELEKEKQAQLAVRQIILEAQRSRMTEEEARYSAFQEKLRAIDAAETSNHALKERAKAAVTNAFLAAEWAARKEFYKAGKKLLEADTRAHADEEKKIADERAGRMLEGIRQYHAYMGQVEMENASSTDKIIIEYERDVEGFRKALNQKAITQKMFDALELAASGAKDKKLAQMAAETEARREIIRIEADARRKLGPLQAERDYQARINPWFDPAELDRQIEQIQYQLEMARLEVQIRMAITAKDESGLDQLLADREARMEEHARIMGEKVSLIEKAMKFMEARASLKSFGNIVKDTFGQVESAFKSSIAAALMGQQSFGEAMKQMTAQILANLAAEAVVQAIYATALGFLRLAQWDFAAAGNAFTSAAIWAMVAAAAGAGAMAMSAGGSGASGSGGSSGGERSTAAAGPREYSDKDLAKILSGGGTRETNAVTRIEERLDQIAAAPVTLISKTEYHVSAIDAQGTAKFLRKVAPQAAAEHARQLSRSPGLARRTGVLVSGS